VEKFLKALKVLCERLEGRGVRWVVGGSLSLALQGVDVQPEDIDLITDEEGAYRIQEILSDFLVRPVRYSSTGAFSSHYGIFEVEGVRIEVMGGLRVHAKGRAVDLTERLDRPVYVKIGDLTVPLSRLDDHLESYRLLDRPKDREKIQKILEQLKNQSLK